MKNIILPLCLLLLLATSAACSRDSQTTPRAEATAPSQSRAAQQQVAMASPPAVADARTTAQPRQAFRSITPQEAMNLISTRNDLLLLDVRNPEELRTGAIAGSTLLPFWNIMRGQMHIAKQQPILLICAVGGRSYAAGQFLAHQGYSEVYSLSGGLDAWKKQGLPVQYQ